MRAYERLLSGEGGENELALLDRIQQGLQNGRCLCGLGDSAGWVIESTMTHFRNEYVEHAMHNTCSAKDAAAVA